MYRYDIISILQIICSNNSVTYRGADPNNPDDIPTRFVPDKPVFAMLPDGTHAIFDSRLILHENTLENPVMDGGGHTVLRSTIRAQRDGLKTMKYVSDIGCLFIDAFAKMIVYCTISYVLHFYFSFMLF